MPNEEDNLTFSQRNGLSPLPPQLSLGEVSNEMKLYFDYYIGLEFERESFVDATGTYFYPSYARVSQDLHVKFFKLHPSSFSSKTSLVKNRIDSIVRGENYGLLFDLVEFFFNHDLCSSAFKTELANVFEETRSAYRVKDNKILAIGTVEQKNTFETALEAADSMGTNAPKTHLISSGTHLRNGDWADSVRESIHAVESVTKFLEPNASTLGPALNKLEQKGYLHGGLKRAFATLYGYTSDEEGIRHAKVFEDVANVDETDALFMLGACSSFVSFVLSRAKER